MCLFVCVCVCVCVCAHACSEVVIFRPPAMTTKMEDSTTVFEGEDLVDFIKSNL